eukprot:2345952-Pleurochrysis_carterae.AAC.1
MSNMACPCDMPSSNEARSSGKTFLCTGSKYDSPPGRFASRHTRMPTVMVKGRSLGDVLNSTLSPCIKVK